MNFITKNVDIDFYGLDDNIDVTLKNCEVNWHSDVEYKSWGISDITHGIDSLQLEITWELLDEDEETEVHELFKDTDGYFMWRPELSVWTVEDEMSVDGGVLQPVQVEVDFKKKIITIS